MKLKLKDNDEFLLDVEQTKAMVKNLFNLPDDVIEVELHRIQAWLESVNKNKRWKTAGVKKGILNWFKKVVETHKISCRETNRGKVVGKYSEEAVRSLEAKYGSDVVLSDTRGKLNLMLEIIHKGVELMAINPLLIDDLDIFREEMLKLFPKQEELVDRFLVRFIDVDEYISDFWGEIDELAKKEMAMLFEGGKNER